MSDIPTPSRDDLIAMRAKGMSREDIAEFYGVVLSRVKRWIKELEIPATQNPKQEKRKHPASNGEVFAPDYGLTMIEKAQIALGKRMGRDYRGYLLDGRVVNVDILLAAAGLRVAD